MLLVGPYVVQPAQQAFKYGLYEYKLETFR